MKLFITLCLTLFACQAAAQQYLLLDKSLSQPAFYSNQVSVSQRYKGFFPVEKKEVGKFVEVLREIVHALLEKPIGKAREYHVGCVHFAGVSVLVSSGKHLDYMLTSNCDGIKVTMHLCDAKLSNEDNAYFINTWIKYIQHAIGGK